MRRNYVVKKILSKTLIGIFFVLLSFALFLSAPRFALETPAGWPARFAFFFVTLVLCPMASYFLYQYRLITHDNIIRQKITRVTIVAISSSVVISSLWFMGFFTPAMLALRYNHNLAKTLFMHNIGVNTSDGRGWTPLGMAVDKGSMDLINLLIEKGADVNGKTTTAKGNVWTPLGMAIKKGNTDLAHLLIEKGADVNQEMTTGWSEDSTHIEDSAWTPLGLAIDKGNMDLIHLLIEKGADVNRSFKSFDGEWTPLGYAIYKNNPELVKFLIVKGAEVDKKSELFYKARSGRLEYSNSVTPLMLAGKLGLNNVITLLLDNGANANSVGPSGFNALTYACQGDGATLETIEILLNHGVDINPNTSSGLTPLRYAVGHRRTEIVKYLVNRGADINSKNDHDATLLIEAIKTCAVEIAELLIDRGIDINAKDREGNTALMYAATWGDETTVKLLLKKGADIQAKNNAGQTAIDFASHSQGGIKTTGILLQYISQNAPY